MMSFTDPNTDNSERADDPVIAYALLDFRWGQLLPWYSKNPQAVPELKAFVEHWKDFKKAWEDAGFATPTWPDLVFYKTKPTEQIDSQRTNLSSAEWSAISHGYAIPHASIDANGSVTRTDTGAATGTNSPGPNRRPSATATPAPAVAGVPTRTPIPVQMAQLTHDTVKTVTLLDNLTDPRRMFPGGPIDPSKGDPNSLCDPCKKDYSSAFCKVINACPGEVGWSDIPLWVWALGATGVASFTALAYASWKAAPYVLPVVAPQTAPYAQAWQQMRAADAMQAQQAQWAAQAQAQWLAQQPGRR